MKRQGRLRLHAITPQITFTIEADYVKDHFQKDLYHSCFHTVYIEIPPGWNGHFT